MKKYISLFLFCFIFLTHFVVSSESVRLTFLHFNDIYEIKDRQGIGGVAMLTTALKRARANARDSITIVSGDFISPSLVSEYTKGSHMIHLFNEMNVDIVTFGNHEFDFGISLLKKRMNESSFVWLNGNVLEKGGALLAPAVQTLIKEMKGVKVGFAGLLTPNTQKVSHVKSLTFIPPVQAATDAVAKLKAEGAEVIVLITHLSIEEDRELAEKVKGIDLILGGHEHNPISYYEHGVLIQKSGSDGEYLGVINLDFIKSEEGSPRIITGWCMRPIFGLPGDRKIASLVNHYTEELEHELKVVVAKTLVNLDSRYFIVRGQESSMGDLITDALKEQYQGDVALLNGGSIRGDAFYPAGSNITLMQLHQELPFGNTAVVVKIKGRELLRALEHGLGGLPQLEGRFPQVSGITVVYNPRDPINQRVKSVHVGNQPLDPDKDYRLVTNDFLFNGGDGYDMLEKGEVVVSSQYGQFVVTCVVDYLKEHPEIEIKEPRLIQSA